MKIIVCVKQVPGTNKVEVDPVTGVLKRNGVASKLNPYDLFALEAAFALVEEYGGSVKTISMGPPQAKSALKETLWMGAEESCLLTDRKFGGADVAATSYALAMGIQQMGEYDLIVCGKQTTDGDTAQVGPEIAERLGLEHAANVTRIIQADSDSIVVQMDLDDYVQTVRMELPCLITIDKDANTPRLPSYVRKKDLDEDACISVLTAADLTHVDETMLGLKGSPTKVERIFSPEKGGDHERLEGLADDLVEQLYKKLKDQRII